MIGCRPLTQDETALILNELKTFRDKALFSLGLYSGFRISEMLSLRWVDVMHSTQGFYGRVKVSRKNTKGKINSRTVIMHPDVKRALNVLYGSVRHEAGFSVTDYVFRSQKGSNDSISRIQAYRILMDAVKKAKISGPVALHSMRKTFASRVHARLGRDLIKTKAALGHKNINSTISYLSFDTKEIDNAILEIGEEE